MIPRQHREPTVRELQQQCQDFIDAVLLCLRLVTSCYAGETVQNVYVPYDLAQMDVFYSIVTSPQRHLYIQ